MRITVRAHPGASRERVEWKGETLHVWVGARAIEGAANRALVQAIARWLGVRPSAVTLVAGGRGRDKVVEVEPGPAESGQPDATAGSPGRS